MAGSRLMDMANWMMANPASDAQIHSATFNAMPRRGRGGGNAEANRAAYEAKRTERIQRRLEQAIQWSPTPAFNAQGSSSHMMPMTKMGIEMGPQQDAQGATWYPVAFDTRALQPGDVEWMKARMDEAKARTEAMKQAALPPTGGGNG